ncbi:hypothetical protein SESBI_20506 [Sesbania bispinosa]|nr:hypothetical protein SESBI_20506 [Sesbania bispinosa]
MEGLRVFWEKGGHEDPKKSFENFQEMGGNAGKVLVSPRNEALEKVDVLCLVGVPSM